MARGPSRSGFQVDGGTRTVDPARPAGGCPPRGFGGRIRFRSGGSRGAGAGLVHSSATWWAAVGPRPRWVMLGTSTPLVMTSFTIASPRRVRGDRDRDRADADGSPNSSPAIWPGAGPARRPATGPGTADSPADAAGRGPPAGLRVRTYRAARRAYRERPAAKCSQLAGVIGHGHQGVEGVGLDWFRAASPAGAMKAWSVMVLSTVGRRTGPGGAAGGQVPATFGVGVLPAATVLVDAPVGRFRVWVSSGPDPGACLPQQPAMLAPLARAGRFSADRSASAALVMAAACAGDSSPLRSAPATVEARDPVRQRPAPLWRRREVMAFLVLAVPCGTGAGTVTVVGGGDPSGQQRLACRAEPFDAVELALGHRR